ncbi:YceI family protein [Opitutus sp. GAS368]|uniref:YceI family protein n=1 Tax=Opitutus sp. GAS368 TaxID=1882749 RepID=UPI00087D65F4|nr:YceI family protein [Opitutus sp. GAS368]SDR71582.1 Polyisoprenoid-binding protein YceI [Opitutus sp. GAS368]
MKRLLVLFAAVSLAAAVRADVETYAIDPVHSSAGFSIRHMLSKFSSSFTKTTGTITVDRANLEKSSVEASVEIASISTANPDRDKHLQTPDFFDAAQFPAMLFKSKAWKKTGEGTFDVTGDLTIKGVTKEVVLKVTSLGFGPGMRPGTQLSGWEATTVIKKSDFGVNGPAMLGKVLGDDVTVDISIEAGLKKA